VIQVLDPAAVPERKAKPHRAMVVIVAAVLALFVALFWALAMEVRQRLLRAPKSAAQLAELKTYLKFR